LSLENPCACIAGPWKVNPRWVLDSENFNEWMNPVDYETEEAIAEQEKLGLLIEGPSGACLSCRPLFHIEQNTPGLAFSQTCKFEACFLGFRLTRTLLINP